MHTPYKDSQSHLQGWDAEKAQQTCELGVATHQSKRYLNSYKNQAIPLIVCTPRVKQTHNVFYRGGMLRKHNRLAS